MKNMAKADRPKSATAMLPLRPLRGSGNAAQTAFRPDKSDAKIPIPSANHVSADLGIPHAKKNPLGALLELLMETLARRADHEGPVIFIGFVVFDQAEALDHREPRTSVHFGDESLDRGGRTSDERLDRAVGSVAHPAGHVQSQRRAARELAIAHALHGAFDQDAANEGEFVGHGRGIFKARRTSKRLQ